MCGPRKKRLDLGVIPAALRYVTLRSGGGKVILRVTVTFCRTMATQCKFDFGYGLIELKGTVGRLADVCALLSAILISNCIFVDAEL